MENVEGIEKLMDEEVGNFCGDMAEDIYSENEGPGKAMLIAPEQKKERIKKELFEAFKSMKEFFYDGLRLLYEGVKDVDPDCFEEYSIYFSEDDTLEELLSPENIFAASQQEISLQTLLSWPEELMDVLFSAAENLYQQHSFHDAVKAFGVLAILNPTMPHYWVGLGLSKQFEREDLDGALDAYYMAMALDSQNPYPCVYRAECFIILKEYNAAMFFLDMAEKRIDGVNYDDLRSYIDTLRIKNPKERR